MEACAAIQAIPILDEALFPGARTPLTAPSGVFRTADGWLTLVAVNEATFRSALRAIDLATLIEDERFAQPQVRLRNADALNQAVERRLTEQTLAHWVARLTEEDALFAPVQDYSGLREMEQAKHAGLFAALEQPPFGAIRVPRPPGATAEWSPRPAPAPGADADSVLAELGFDRNRIAALEACGALHRPGTAARMNG